MRVGTVPKKGTGFLHETDHPINLSPYRPLLGIPFLKKKKGTGFYKIHTGVRAHYRVEVEHLKKTCPQIGFGLIRPDEAIYVVTIPQH